jgi:hypothetical protein
MNFNSRQQGTEIYDEPVAGSKADILSMYVQT